MNPVTPERPPLVRYSTKGYQTPVQTSEAANLHTEMGVNSGHDPTKVEQSAELTSHTCKHCMPGNRSRWNQLREFQLNLSLDNYRG